jgi:cell fate (sporulation/competence/biofilm development) regulator YlbF (YheA/YmcA/DUF963 family)
MSLNIYDEAHRLARLLKETDEYRAYATAKQAAESNETNRLLIKEYKKLQFQLQVSMAGGSQANAEDMERLQKISGVLQFSPEAAAYLMAEMQLQRMLADIYKIIGEAAGMDMDFMNL